MGKVVSKIFKVLNIIFIVVLCGLFIFILYRPILWRDYYFGNTPKFSYEDNKNSPNASVLKYNDELFINGNLSLTINFSRRSKMQKIGYIKGDFWGSIVFGTYALFKYNEDVDNNFIIQKRSSSQDVMCNYVNLNTIVDLYNVPIEKVGDKDVSNISINDLIDQEANINIQFQDSLDRDIYLQENYSFVEDMHFYYCVYLVNDVLYIQKFSTEDYKAHYYNVKLEYYDIFL